MVVINHDRLEFAHALNDWRKRFGFVKCKDIDLFNSRSAVRAGRYLGKYCSKGVFENPLVALGKVEKSFRLFSKHFGITYVYRMRGFHLGLRLNVAYKRFENHIRTDAYMDYIVRNSVVYVAGDSFPHHMPRYYKDKIYGSKNPFSCQKEDYLFRMASLDDSRQLAAIQSAYHCSTSEAYHKKDMLFSEEILYRAKLARSKIINFYKQSQL